MVREISSDRTLRQKLIPLAFHVDYWNHLGWRDPLSSAEWTQRQSRYVSSMALASAYTPQMVVDGKRQFVGSNSGALDSAIADESRQPPFGSVSAHLSREGGTLQAQLEATVTTAAPVDLVVVVFEDGIPTSIAAGENGGSAAIDDAVVRKLIRAGSTAHGTLTKSIEIPIDRGWNPARLGIAAFLQDPRTLAIRGAVATRLQP